MKWGVTLPGCRHRARGPLAQQGCGEEGDACIPCQGTHTPKEPSRGVFTEAGLVEALRTLGQQGGFTECEGC